jgi:hypothetical protein
MSNIGYNERSWGIDIISEINSIVSQINKPIKRASGELTVRGSNSLFPDVILFGERNMESYIQGWELKFPDTNISDNELINNATKKAKRLKLNSFLLWNVTTAVLYVADSNGFFSIQKTWNDLSHITKRDQVINAQNEWLTLLKKIINDLNYFFEEGKITSRTVIDSFSDNGVIDFIINNSENDKEYLIYKNNIELIKNKINKVIIKETPKNSNYTSYSVNKGEELFFCIRSKKDNKIHDLNDLLYVAIHEIAHIGCPEIGHTDLFFKINLYLLKKAVEFNLYKYDNYNTQPREYCGIDLNNTLLK